MVKQALLNIVARFELPYRLAHPDIPKPQIGFRPNWEERHAKFDNLILDHSSCPGIQAREQIGITLFMPYTCRFFREGHVEVETYWETEGPSLFRFSPAQEMVTIRPKGDKFPGYIVELPKAPDLKWPLHMFVLGDVRLGAWIIQAGIHLSELPENYTLFLMPLPNYRYPKGFSVGQAMALSLPNISGQLKIPVDIDFSSLSPEEKFVEIPRGQPMVQYIPVKLPEIRLTEESSGYPAMDTGERS